jgi:HlyD family secretion protein
MDKTIFRQVSLDRLSSPEQLDQVLRATSPKGWAGLIAVLLLLATALVWGFEGAVVTSAQGQGVIVRSGGVLNVVTRGGGVVLSLNAKVGDRIQANQAVATIAQPILAEKIRALREAMAEAIREREHALHVRTDSAKLQIDAIQRQRTNAETQIGELEEQLKVAKDQLAADEQLAVKGLITKQQALVTKQRTIEIRDQISSLEAQMKQLDAQKFASESQPQQEDADSRSRVSTLQRELAAAEQELALAEVVVSPYDGQVLELKVNVGGNVSMGEPVLSIQPDVHNLELVAYVPASQAKDAKPGMETQISPATVKREEYGFLKGEVVYVSDFPSTQAALMRNFQNEFLARTLSASGPVTEIWVALKPDPKTPTGFKWSTSKGPNLQISSGTICTLQIVTKREKPITLLFPYIKKKLDLN